MDNDLIEETREAVAMLKTVIEFEPATDRIIKDEAGNYHAGKTEPFIKLGLAFRGELAACKGAPLAVFLSICLHLNEEGRAWPGIRTICQETDYESATVVKAIRRLRDIGLIRVTPRRGTSSIYEPLLAGFGRGKVKAFQKVKHPGVSESETHPPQKVKQGVSESETKEYPIRITNKRESAGAPSHAPTGKAQSAKAARDAFDIQASFEALKANGRAAGADQTAAAHPMAGRWPHLVAHCRSFEEAAGMDASVLTPAILKAWAAQLEDHINAGLTSDDEKTLVSMARARRWDVVQPKSVSNLIGVMRAKPAAAAAERAAKPLY